MCAFAMDVLFFCLVHRTDNNTHHADQVSAGLHILTPRQGHTSALFHVHPADLLRTYVDH